MHSRSVGSLGFLDGARSTRGCLQSAGIKQQLSLTSSIRPAWSSHLRKLVRKGFVPNATGTGRPSKVRSSSLSRRHWRQKQPILTVSRRNSEARDANEQSEVRPKQPCMLNLGAVISGALCLAGPASAAGLDGALGMGAWSAETVSVGGGVVLGWLVTRLLLKAAEYARGKAANFQEPEPKSGLSSTSQQDTATLDRLIQRLQKYASDPDRSPVSAVEAADLQKQALELVLHSRDLARKKAKGEALNSFQRKLDSSQSARGTEADIRGLIGSDVFTLGTGDKDPGWSDSSKSLGGLVQGLTGRLNLSRREGERPSVWGSASGGSGGDSDYGSDSSGLTVAARADEQRQRQQQELFERDLRKTIVHWPDIDVSFDSLPYYLSEGSRAALINAAYVHLKRTDYVKYLASLPVAGPKLLLWGPTGTEMCQEAVAKALARHYQARFLVFDSTADWTEQEGALNGDSDGSTSSSESEDLDALEGFVALPSDDPDSDPGYVKAFMDAMLQGAISDRRRSIPGTPFLVSEPGSPLSSIVVGASPLDLPPVFKEGDRVKYVGPRQLGTRSSSDSPSSRTKFKPSPQVGAKGRVVIVSADNPSKVGVQFDKSRPKAARGGKDRESRGRAVLEALDSMGAVKEGPLHKGVIIFVDASELQPAEAEQDSKSMAMDALFKVATEEAQKGPIVVYLRDLERWLLSPPEGRFERYQRLQQHLDQLVPGVLVVGAYAPLERSAAPTRAGGERQFGMKVIGIGPGKPGQLDSVVRQMFEEAMAKGADGPGGAMGWGGEAGGGPPEYLSQLFPTQMQLQPPQDEPHLSAWVKQLEEDRKTMTAEGNRQTLKKVLRSSGLECSDLDSVALSSRLLELEVAQKVVGLAANQHLMRVSDPVVKDDRLQIGSEDVHKAVQLLEALSGEPSARKSLKDVNIEDEYERKLMGDVIPPGAVGVSFDDIGALEGVKDTLKELVMLPLQRPELFRKGQLTKPAKGVLLFGPPGTGKTMLAKAVATEAGANFINISVSSITSKWFGEAEKLVKAIFTLASKLAPTVIFVDEVDSLLGARGGGREHEAMRKMRNEFMAAWDGLKSQANERVLVLAATNRPFDLDQAVIRRMPRRILIDLPDEENRAKILRVILKDEELAAEFDFAELAKETEGYSGSDLKNLCIAAAYQPVREILEKEKKEGKLVEGALDIRPLRLEDFLLAKKQVGASVSKDDISSSELIKWNEEFGEGGSRRKKKSLGFSLDFDDVV